MAEELRRSLKLFSLDPYGIMEYAQPVESLKCLSDMLMAMGELSSATEIDFRITEGFLPKSDEFLSLTVPSDPCADHAGLEALGVRV